MGLICRYKVTVLSGGASIFNDKDSSQRADPLQEQHVMKIKTISRVFVGDNFFAIALVP